MITRRQRTTQAARAVRAACTDGESFLVIIVDRRTGDATSESNLTNEEAIDLVAAMVEANAK